MGEVYSSKSPVRSPHYTWVKSNEVARVCVVVGLVGVPGEVVTFLVGEAK